MDNIQESKINRESIKQDVPKPKKEQNNIAQIKPNPPSDQITYNINDFKKEELIDPDYIDNLNSLKVLDFKGNKMQVEFKKIDGRIPRDLRDKFNKIQCKKQILMQQAQNGDITENDYLKIMKVQLDHDRKLLAYFKDQKNNLKAFLVNERISLLIKEIEEGINKIKNK